MSYLILHSDHEGELEKPWKVIRCNNSDGAQLLLFTGSRHDAMAYLAAHWDDQGPPSTKSYFIEAKACQAALDAEVARCGLVLNAFPKGAMGLTPDAVKFSHEYRAAKATFDNAFKRLRTFNAWHVKAHKDELREERRIRNKILL
jgi:hypothetical protein